jgi:hypothetical protein
MRFAVERQEIRTLPIPLRRNLKFGSHRVPVDGFPAGVGRRRPAFYRVSHSTNRSGGYGVPCRTEMAEARTGT